MIDLLTLLSSVTALLIGAVAWNFITFRNETRAAHEKLWEQISPLSRDVAVIKAVQAERHELVKMLRSEQERLPPVQ